MEYTVQVWKPYLTQDVVPLEKKNLKKSFSSCPWSQEGNDNMQRAHEEDGSELAYTWNLTDCTSLFRKATK